MNIGPMMKDQAVKWSKRFGTASVSGNKNELLDRIKKFSKYYPKIVEKLTRKASWSYSFATSLEGENTPPPFSSNKILNEYHLSAVSNDTILTYASAKTEGSSGQQERAYRLFQSRKIVSVRSLYILVVDVFFRYVSWFCYVTNRKCLCDKGRGSNWSWLESVVILQDF